MADMKIKEARTALLRVAIIFLLVGIFAGSGTVLCVMDFIPFTTLLIKIFSSIAVMGLVILGIVAYEELSKFFNVTRAKTIQFKETEEWIRKSNMKKR